MHSCECFSNFFIKTFLKIYNVFFFSLTEFSHYYHLLSSLRVKYVIIILLILYLQQGERKKIGKTHFLHHTTSQSE